MNENQTMISAAMLEAVWQSRKKDMIDLITPFVMYATATLTSPNEEINIPKVQSYVQQKYAYTDIPEAIIRKVLDRKPYSSIRKERHKFYLNSPVDLEVSQMNDRKRECERYLHILGESLSKYLNVHCTKMRNFTEKSAINCLHTYFSRYGLQTGMDELASVSISPRDYETDYYIARFIFECKDAKREEYIYLNSLIKGYFLRLAIYIQPENGNIKSEKYSNTTFFYDTPFLIDLLGYSASEKEKNARLLHDMIKRQNGKFCYFPHIHQELVDILHAYKRSLNPRASFNRYRTLDGLNAKNFNSSDVEREISLLPSKLKNDFGIVEHDVPLYDMKEDGSVDEQKILAETELKQHIRNKTLHYTEANLENDIKSALAIHRLRGEYVSNNIEKCRFIFVTNNYDFTNAFNEYYKNKVNNRTFQLIITDSDLSAITWIKCGEINNLPESELLKNAYCALQPIPEIMEKICEVLQKLKLSGHLTPDQVMALRADRVFQNEIWINTIGENGNITEASVLEAHEKYQKQLLSEREKQQSEKNRKAADSYASQKRKRWISRRKRLLFFVMFVFIFFGILGVLFSCTRRPSNVLCLILSIISTILGMISVIDTVLSRKRFLIQVLERKANQYETRVRENKLREYESLTNPNWSDESVEN